VPRRADGHRPYCIVRSDLDLGDEAAISWWRDRSARELADLVGDDSDPPARRPGPPRSRVQRQQVRLLDDVVDRRRSPDLVTLG
jgi:hypothetical protein